MNKDVVETIIQSEYKNFLLNKKCLRHLMNRIQSKDNKIVTYVINKIPLSCLEDKIHIPNNEDDGLVLGYCS